MINNLSFVFNNSYLLLGTLYKFGKKIYKVEENT